MADSLKRIPVLFHFTDPRNLANIRELGGIYPTATLREMGIDVVAPGGNQLSQDLDKKKGLDKFVHLCFRPVHPMAYVAHKAGRIDAPIFLAVSPEVLDWEGVMFTPDVANKTGVPMFPIKEAEGIIDYEVLYTRMDWRDPAVKGRLDQAEKCEILVPHQIPIELIRNLPNG